MQQAVPPPRRVGLPTKLAYGFGSIAYGIKDNGFSTLLLLFYNQVVGLPAGLVGAALLMALVLDAAIDPVIGHLSDHTRSRWGRRHPFMYAAAIPVGVLYLLLWNPPVHASHAVILAYLVVTSVLVRAALSCYEIPSSALAPELTTDYHERTSVLGYRYLFGWLGGVGMLLLVFGYFLAATPAYPVGQLNPAGYRHYAIAASLVMAVAILLSALGTHREIATLPGALPKRTNLRGAWRGITATLRNRPFVILMVAGIFSFTNQGLNFALGTYFNTYVWHFGAKVLAIFVLALVFGIVLSFPLASVSSRLVGKRRAAVAAGLLYIVFALAPLLLRLEGLFPANDSPLLLPMLLGSTAIGAAIAIAGAILGSSMMSDVVEDSQARTGERTEGVFFAGSFLMQKCVSGLGLFLSGAILSWSHFPTGAAVGAVPQDVLSRLTLTYCALTAVLGVASAFVLARFPLGEADHLQRLAELAEVLSHTAPLPGSEAEMPIEAGPA